MAGAPDPAHGSMLWEGVLEPPAWRTHLSSVRWTLPGKCEKMSLVCSAFHSKKFSLGWEDDRRLLSGWMEKFTVRGPGLSLTVLGLLQPEPGRNSHESSSLVLGTCSLNIKPQNHQTKTMRPHAGSPPLSEELLWDSAQSTRSKH